jgi:hypothetical protein
VDYCAVFEIILKLLSNTTPDGANIRRLPNTCDVLAKQAFSNRIQSIANLGSGSATLLNSHNGHLGENTKMKITIQHGQEFAPKRVIFLGV